MGDDVRRNISVSLRRLFGDFSLGVGIRVVSSRYLEETMKHCSAVEEKLFSLFLCVRMKNQRHLTGLRAKNIVGRAEPSSGLCISQRFRGLIDRR